MVRYPFRQAVSEWMEEYSDFLSPTSFKVRSRALRRICGYVEDLYAHGKLSTMDPAKFTIYDVRVFVMFLRNTSPKLKASTIDREVVNLQSICLFCHNDCVRFAKARWPRLVPLVSKGGTQILNKYHISIIKQHVSNRAPDELRPWMPIVLSLATGARANEFRNFKVEDFDLSSCRALIRVPKGIDSWGHVRTVPIRPEFIDTIRIFVTFVGSGYLFPNSEGVPMSTKTLAAYRRRICSEILGFSFDFRVCRATYGQLMLDEGLPLEAVSVLLGHSRSETTEGYYARVRNTVAVEDALALWYDDSEDADFSAESEDKPDSEDLFSAFAKSGERGGIRTLGLQLRRLPPYPG